MHDLFLQHLELDDAGGNIRRYDYYITIDQIDVGPYSCESYGVRIEEQGGGQVAEVHHITSSISRIDELCDLLLRNAVTPVTLGDVISDWL